MLGALMAESGAADRLVSTILKHSTPRSLPWMMALVAIIIGMEVLRLALSAGTESVTPAATDSVMTVSLGRGVPRRL